MLPLLQKHMLITTAFLATLGLSACGKKTETMNGGGKPSVEVKKPNVSGKNSSVESTDSKNSNNSNNSNKNSSKNKNNGGRNGELADLPEPGAGGDTDYTPPIADGGDAPPAVGDGAGKPTLPPVVDNSPLPAPSQPLDPSYNPRDAKNVKTDSYGRRLTGGVTEDGFLYTSSSVDNVLDILRMQGSDVAAAQSVISASVSGDGSVVTLKINENGAAKTYKLSASSGVNSAYPTSLVSSGRSVSGTLRCLDQDGSCETMLAQIKLGYSQATVNVVFRNTNADLYFHLPAVGASSGNPEFERLQNMALNTIKRNGGTNNRASSARMSSWEVVNGRAGFSVSITTFENESLIFSGPLLISGSGTSVNANLRVSSSSSMNSRMANTIGDARLVANNSLGQVRLSLQMRKRGGYAQDQMEVTFMRKIKAVVNSVAL